MPNPAETRSWKMGLDVLCDQTKLALQRENRYADLFAPQLA